MPRKSNVVVVFGSRSWKDREAIKNRLKRLPKGTVIRHGGAIGADRKAGDIALTLGFTVHEVKPDYNRHYHLEAPKKRNILMLEMKPVPYLAIGFWDGKSTGSKHMMKECAKHGIKTEIHLPHGEIDADISVKSHEGLLSLIVDSR